MLSTYNLSRFSMASAPLLHHGRYREIASAVAERLAESLHRDSSREIPLTQPLEVVVASRGVADAVLADLIRRIPEGIAGLRLQTLEALARRVVNGAGVFPAVASQPEQRLLMALSARSIHHPLLEAPGMSSLLFRTWRDVRDSGVSLRQFRGHRSRERAAAERSRLIERVWSEYVELLDRLGLHDPADLFETAASSIPGAALSPQLATGFYDLTGLQQTFLDALHAAGRVAGIYLPVALDGQADTSFASRFATHALALSNGLAVGLADPSLPAIGFSSHPSRADELTSIASRIGELLQNGTRPEAIGIVTRSVDPAVRILLENRASRAGFALEPESLMPLHAHRIPRTFLTLLRLHERRMPRRELLELAYEGYQPQGLRMRRSEIEELDRLTRRHRIPGGSAKDLRHAAARIEGRNPPHAESILQLASFAEAIEKLPVPPGDARGDEWAHLLRSFLRHVRVETEQDLEAIASLETLAGFLDRTRALDALLDVTDLRFLIESGDPLPRIDPSPAELPRIWFGDVMQLRGRSFENLFGIALEEETFPQGRIADPLLPDVERSRRSVRQIGDGLDEERLLFRILVDAATDSFHGSFATSDERGKSRRGSPLLQNLATRIHPAAQAEIRGRFTEWCRPQQNDDEDSHPQMASADRDGFPSLRRRLRLFSLTGTRSEYDGYLTMDPQLIRAVADRLAEIPPTDLGDFGECPQRFFVRRILGVRELEDPDHELEMEIREKGSIRHEILERFYTDVKERLSPSTALPARLTEDLRRRLEETIENRFDEYDREVPPWNRWIRDAERRLTRNVLTRFVDDDLAELSKSGFRPEWFEKRFGLWPGDEALSTPLTLEIGGIPMSMRGSIDRIDVHEDGRHRVVDYKSGAALYLRKIADRIDAGHALQLPLYALASAILFELADSEVCGVIKPFERRDKLEHFEFQLADRRPSLDRVLRVFVDEIRAGAFPAFPDAEVCRFCPVNASCRTLHDPRERAAVSHFQNALELMESLDG